MNQLHITAIALAVGFAFSTGAMAKGMSTGEYKSDKRGIETEYKSAKANCDSFSGNAKDICMAQAQGKEHVAKAELEARYKPSAKNHYQARIAQAEADYAVAKEKCDDKDGNVKDVCLKEAEAAQTTARANAKAQMKTSDANATADEKSADARRDATADKRDAAYAVAREKCDSYAGDAKDRCLTDAKARYDKS